jgi:hypothetical protein
MPSNVSENWSSDDTVLFERSSFVNLPTMNLRNTFFATLALAAVAHAQALPVPGAGANPTTSDWAYQVSYISNITAGQSYINITNDGARGGSTQTAGSAATVGGSICANVYVVAADEEFVSCCSCPVTPDGLVALSNTDLTSNPLGRVGFNSVTVKLVATVPVGGTCSGSAATIASPATVLANGMAAWATHLHQNTSTTPSSFSMTETKFTPATIDGGFAEMAKLQALCVFAIAQGTGTGICSSCELQGLGAASSNQ